MLKLFITRHGETPYNIENRIQGNIDTELTQEGIEQAKMLAEHFGSDIDYVISGTLKRQTQTADILGRPRGRSVIMDSRLNERDWGRFNGRTEEEIDTGGIPLSRYLFYMDAPSEGGNPNIQATNDMGQSIEDVTREVGTFYDDLVAKYREATIIIVGSQYSNAYLLNYMFQIPANNLVFFVQENMCIDEINIDYDSMQKNKRRVVVVNTNFMEHVHSRGVDKD